MPEPIVSITRLDARINVDLWPPGAWTAEELRVFVESFDKYAPTSGRISSGVRGVEIQIAIAFAAGAIAAGFFSEMGKDLYSSVRTRLKQALLKRTDRATIKDENQKVTGWLSLSYCEPGVSTIAHRESNQPGLDAAYRCVYNSERELDAFLSSIAELDNLIRKGYDSKSFPFDAGTNHEVFADLKFSPRSVWNVRIRRYTEQNGELTLNEFFSAGIDPDALQLKWEQIGWS
jgi:hypothetical protein